VIQGEIVSAIVGRDIHPLVAQLLVQKGINDEALLEVTFDPKVENLPPPELIPDMEEAVKLTAKFVGRKEPILIWGHDDADGVTGTSILYDALKTVEGRVLYYIPDKKSKGGHSINEEGLKFASQHGVKLIITNDCCTNSEDEIGLARDMGMEVIVTDHHEVFVENPDYLIVNPKRGGAYPYLSGSAVALKFAWYLFKITNHWDISAIVQNKPEYFVWATIGIIADRMPIFSENRAIYNKAEEIFTEHTFVFQKAYENVKNRKPTLYELTNIISSSQTKGSYHEGVELLMTKDINVAEEIMRRLVTFSDIWYHKAEELLSEVIKDVSVSRPYILVDLGKKGMGYLGYVANKLKEKYKVPSIALGRREDRKVVGELRAPQGFDTLQLLESLSWMLIDYGGHKVASGFSMDEAFLPSLLEEVEAFFSEMGKIDYTKAKADLILKADEVDDRFFKDLVKMGFLGLNAYVLIEGKLEDITNKMLSVRVIDPQGFLGLYPPETKVRILLQTTPDGLYLDTMEKL